MGLLGEPAALAELIAHLVTFEGDVPHFYYDSQGLITIAIGELVDTRAPGLPMRRAVAQQFANSWHARFVKAAGGIATAAQVLADWDAVAALPIGARSRASCQAACACRLPAFGDRRAIALSKITGFYNALVGPPRQFMGAYHPKIHMAFVDTRYNPGIPMYGHAGDVGHMWHALDPTHASFDPLHARELFARIWRGVKPNAQRYQNRVSWRLDRFDEGLRANPAHRTPVWSR